MKRFLALLAFVAVAFAPLAGQTTLNGRPWFQSGYMGGQGQTIVILPGTTFSGSFPFSGPMLGGAGSAAAPTYSFSSDPDTGMFRVGANSLGFAANGARTFTMDVNGDLSGASTNKLSMPSTGGVSLTAAGTNQSVTLAPSGTGVSRLGVKVVVDDDSYVSPVSALTSGWRFMSSGQMRSYVAGTIELQVIGGQVVVSNQLASFGNSVASTPAGLFTGTWFTGGSATTTKPHVLVEPTGATSTAWSTSGTGLGINAANAFAGNLIDAQVNGTSKFSVTSAGAVTIGGGSAVTKVLTATATWDPANLAADGDATSTTITVTGAAVGDVCMGDHDQIGANNVVVSAFVETPDNVRFLVMNKTGAGFNIASGTARVTVVRH